MNGSQLTLYASNQRRRIRHLTVVEWILEEAARAGIVGATVAEISEAVDSSGKLHAARFFELVDQPVAVTLIADDTKIEALLGQLRAASVHLFFTRMPIEYGSLGVTDDA